PRDHARRDGGDRLERAAALHEPIWPSGEDQLAARSDRPEELVQPHRIPHQSYLVGGDPGIGEGASHRWRTRDGVETIPDVLTVAAGEVVVERSEDLDVDHG